MEAIGLMIPKRYLLILGTFLLSMLLYVDRACISAAKETICDPSELAFSDTQWGWIMAAFSLGYALCQTPAGVLADRFGPRRILTAVVVSLRFAVGSLPVVEVFFDWPGLGVTMLNGIFQREATVVAGAALGLGVTFLLINMGLDLLYRYIDPRLRTQNHGGGQ